MLTENNWKILGDDSETGGHRVSLVMKRLTYFVHIMVLTVDTLISCI